MLSAKSNNDDCRALANERALRLSTTPTRKSPISSKKNSPSHRQSLLIEARNDIHLQKIDNNASVNPTIIDAKLAAIDYKLNGYRARSNTGDFVRPRWVPDAEEDKCHGCSQLFDWVIRRHHCRNCGCIYCNQCSNTKLLLPQEFCERNPQRVCKKCAEKLMPVQETLSASISNKMRSNSIQLAGGFNFRRYLSLPYTKSLGSSIRNASYSTYNLLEAVGLIRNEQIPIKLISEAKGVAFLTVAKGGMLLAPSFGCGLVISRLPNRQWSAPTAISIYGLAYGALIGADVTDYVCILNSEKAVEAFFGNLVTVGGEIEVAAGPFGRSGQVFFNINDCLSINPVYSYSHTKGFYASLSLNGSLIVSRSDVNHRFYGLPVTPQDLLSGKVDPPKAAEVLYDALREVLTYDSLQI